MISAIEALRILQDGNRRFVAGLGGVALATNQARRAQLIMGQQPFAVLLGCADSRVPGELVFDQGLGELFVIRVAGNIVAPSQIGSVEFAVERFSTRLVVGAEYSLETGMVDFFDGMPDMGQDPLPDLPQAQQV